MCCVDPFFWGFGSLLLFAKIRFLWFFVLPVLSDKLLKLRKPQQITNVYLLNTLRKGSASSVGDRQHPPLRTPQETRFDKVSDRPMNPVVEEGHSTTW